MKKLIALALAAGVLTSAALAVGAAKGDSALGGSAAKQIACGTTRNIGLAAPLTGLAASLGQQQRGWARFYVSRWNAKNPRAKIRLVEADTQLPNTAAALRAAQELAGNASVLGVVGPAGSQEVVVSSPPLKAKGLGFVTGSATRTTLTQESIRKGFFFRVVPPDSVQSVAVANQITQKLRATRIAIVDDQETYGVGLSDEVQRILRGRNVNVQRESVAATASDFSSIVAKIPGNTQVVYLPWQIAGKAQLFGQQMREQGKNATLFGSDGLFDPSTFKISGSYLSFFPVARTSPLITAYKRSHGGDAQYFGAPTYAATQVVAGAVTRACKDGKATRAEVRNQIKRTDIAAKNSVLGLRIRFNANGDLRGGKFGIFRIAANGAYNPVG